MLHRLFLLFFAFLSLSSTQPPKKSLILVSIPPYQEIVEKIGGDHVEVMTIAPPSSDPHTYEPTARQITKLAEGIAWFQIGEPFEKKLSSKLSAKKIDLRKTVHLLHEEGSFCPSCSHSGEDRHIWLSLKEMEHQADKIQEVLSELLPEHKAEFQERLAHLKLELALLDVEIKDRLSSLENRSFVVSHPAFAYFCRDYDLRQLSVEQEGKEPRPKELEALLEDAKEAHSQIAIAIPQHNNRGTELIAKKLDLSLHTIDPYSPHYFETLQNLSLALHDSN